MIRILIDGYNLLHASEISTNSSVLELETQREELLNRLHRYQTEKKHSIQIVFDGRKDFSGMARDKKGAIVIEFSQSPETADHRIMRICENSQASLLVVSGDREIQRCAKRCGHDFIESRDFLKKLKSTPAKASSPEEFMEEDEDDLPLYPKINTQKKGQSRKPSKSDRKKQSKLRKL